MVINVNISLKIIKHCYKANNAWNQCFENLIIYHSPPECLINSIKQWWTKHEICIIKINDKWYNIKQV